MRQWINLFENADLKPSFTAAVTDELIHDILTTGKWVDHGADLDDWWESRYAEHYDFPEFVPVEEAKRLAGRAWEDVKEDATAQAILRNDLTSTAQWYDDNLTVTGETWVYRGLFLPMDGDKYAEFDPTAPLGRFWSTDKFQPNRFMNGFGQMVDGKWDEYRGGTVVFLRAQLKNCTINWEETIRSRLDQGNGDEEEIQLATGTPIRFHTTIWDVPPRTNGHTVLGNRWDNVKSRILIKNGDNFLTGTV